MAFNHYAKIKRILANEPAGWYIQRTDEPTRADTWSTHRDFTDYFQIDYCFKQHTPQQLKRDLLSFLNITGFRSVSLTDQELISVRQVHVRLLGLSYQFDH